MLILTCILSVFFLVNVLTVLSKFFLHVFIISQFKIVSDSTKRETDRKMDRHY